MRNTPIAVLASVVLVSGAAGVAAADQSVSVRPGTCKGTTSVIEGIAPVTGVAIMEDLISHDGKKLNYTELNRQPVSQGEYFIMLGGHQLGRRTQLYAYIIPAPEVKTSVRFWPLGGGTVDLSNC